MIVTDLFESTPAPGGTNPYGYEVGQTVKLQNGSQGQVVDIFDDSIEVLLPRGNTMTVDFRDAEVLDEYGVVEDANPNYTWIQGDFDGDTATTGSKQGSWRDQQTTQVKLTRGRMTNVRPLSGPPTEGGKTIKQDQIPLTLDVGNQKFSTTGIDLQLTVAPNGYMSQGGVGRVIGTAVVKIMRPENVAEGRQVFTESRHNKLLKEDATYRKFYNLSRLLVERKMSEKEILDLFAAVEAGANATGQNRTALGKGKDAVAGAYTSAKDAISGVLSSIQKSTPVAGVDAAYNDATGALRDAIGNDSKVMNAIKKYRLLAKEYPKTQLFVKTALIALAGLATGGAGLVAIAGVTAAVDAAIKGEKLSSIIGKGAGAALMGLGAQEVQAMLSGGAAPADAIAAGPADAAPAFVPGPDLPTYTVQDGDSLSKIAARFDTSVAELRGLNPQLAADSGAVGGQNLNPDVIFPGQEITLPPGTPGTNVYAGGVGTSADTMADIARGNVPDSAITQRGVPGPEQLGGVEPADVSQAAVDPGKYSAAIDYSQSGPTSTDSLGQKLEYGIPVNDKGSFIPPNAGLPADELARQTAAYDAWKADFTKRFPNAELQPDGSMKAIKPGLAPMGPSNYTPGGAGGSIRPKGFAESVKLITLPASQLIDQKLTVMAWALNESVGKPPARNMHLTRRGVLTVIENVDRHRRALLKELAADGPDRTNIPAVRRADMPLAPQDGVVKPGMIGRGLNWLDKATSKVGGYLSKQAQNFTRKVTAAKLKTEWEQEGHQTDSDYIAAFLTKQGVPQDVVTDVYGKMGIPYTAPVAAPVDGAAAPVGGATRQSYAGMKADGTPYSNDELRNKFFPTAPKTTADATADATADDEVAGDTAAAPNPFGQMVKQMQNYGTSTGGRVTGTATGLKHTANPNNPNAVSATTSTPAAAAATTTATTTKPAAAAAGKFPGEDPQGSNYVGRREVARRQAARDADAAKKPATPNFGGPAGYSSTSYAPNIKTGISLPKPAAGAAPTKTPTQAEKDAYVKSIGAPAMAENRIATALKKPVAEMLQMVETKEDVQKIKQFVDQTFVRYGAVNESAFVVRNQILEHVTQVGAQRRRDFAAQRTH